MQLVVITRETTFSDEAAILNSLLAEGLMVLHLRKPGACDDDIRTLLRQINPMFHGRIIIHGHTALCDEFGLLGVHLPIAEILGKEKLTQYGVVSCSAHTYAEVVACRDVADRVFVSPMFDSISKNGYMGNATLLTIPKHDMDTVLVALGGVTSENLSVLQQYGFKAAALMGYIWEEGQPLKQFEKCRAAVEKSKAEGGLDVG